MDEIINLCIDQKRAITLTLSPVDRQVLFTVYRPYPLSDEEDKTFYGKSLTDVIGQVINHLKQNNVLPI